MILSNCRIHFPLGSSLYIATPHITSDKHPVAFLCCYPLVRLREERKKRMRCFALVLMAAAVEQTVAFAVLPAANLRLPATTRQSVVEHAISKAPEEAVNHLEQDDENVNGHESFVKQNITNSSDSFEQEVNGKDAPQMDEDDVEDEVSNSVEEDVNEKDIPQLDDDLLFDRDDEGLVFDEEDEDAKFDVMQMRHAIQLAQSNGGERGAASPYPKPIAGAVIVAENGRILGKGRSDYKEDCIRAAIRDAGLVATPLREWCVSWSSDRALREALASSTLYTTLEPSDRAQGEAMPPITQLIEQAGIPRVVIGCANPIPERATEGAATLHSAGISVSMGVEQQDCERLIEQYAELANSKFQVMSRKFAERNGRPLGFLHCSVVDSDDVEAFARAGNAFGKNFGGKNLSSRNFGSYAIAPPPEFVWAKSTDDDDDDFETEIDDIFSMDFDEEDYQASMDSSPMMPWYGQVDAVVATFPRSGNGPRDDNSITARLHGLKWLATVGEGLPSNVERILVMDATDLVSLPLTNDDPNLPRGVDVETFWKGHGRKPTRVLLRRGENAQAQAAAKAAARAAAAAARAAEKALLVVETGEAAEEAELALQYQADAAAATALIQEELQAAQNLKRKLSERGVLVETLKGGEPVDVMKHLGKRSGYQSVVWRAGCWGDRGVRSILADAFQWVSAHLAVDAVGGKFWQLMLAERAVQAACGPERKVKIYADQEDIGLEYCDAAGADQDCALTVDGRPVRHVRLDCRIALVDESRPREIQPPKTEKYTKKLIEEQAPWFL